MEYLTHLDPSNPTVATKPKYPGLHFVHPVKYWDFHIYYDESSEPESTELRNRFLQDFPAESQEGLVIVKKLPDDKAIGPHYFPFWEVDVARVDVFAKVLSWFSLRHGLLSVLVHPQTGDDLKDHTGHALWLGEKKPLKTEVFAPEPQGIPEFGRKQGVKLHPNDFDAHVPIFE